MAPLSKMQARRWLKKAGRIAGWIAPVVFFGLALWALHDSLREYRTADIAAAFGELAPPRIALSLALTACGYLVLAGYDLLAFRHIGRRLRLRDFGLTSFMSNALGNSVGNILITGAAVRYWIYTSLGISAAEVAKVVIFCSLGFWLGFLVLGSLAALVAFRALYFILPLAIAIAWLALRQLRKRFRIAALVPDLSAAAVFLCGAVLLASGVLPATAGRLAWLHKFLTVPVIEISHFTASLIGTALLFLAPMLRRRIYAAYV